MLVGWCLGFELPLLLHHVTINASVSFFAAFGVQPPPPPVPAARLVDQQRFALYQLSRPPRG